MPGVPPLAGAADARDGGGPAPRRCANCGTAAPLDYCPACGQEQHDLHRSLRGVLAEVLDNVAGWDGKILATFRLLLVRPGALTAEFLAGRRVRYLRPLRVFFLASLAFVLALQLSFDDGGLRFDVGDEGVRVGASSDRADSSVARPDSARPDTARPDTAHARTGRPDREARRARAKARLDSFALARRAKHERLRASGRTPSLEDRIGEAFEARALALQSRSGDEVGAMLKRNFFGNLGTVLFLLVPVFALLVHLLWRRAGLFYAEHAVFALHVHAQALLALAIGHLVPGAAGGVVATCWPPAYLWLALRRVYGRGRERRRRTTVKFVALTGVYGVVLAVGLTALVVVALFLDG